VLNPSQTLLITSADKNRERKNKGKGGKKHAASPKQLGAKIAERSVPRSIFPFVFLSFVFFVFFLFSVPLLFCSFFDRPRERTGQPQAE
jgi:hypothetical protein